MTVFRYPKIVAPLLLCFCSLSECATFHTHHSSTSAIASLRLLLLSSASPGKYSLLLSHPAESLVAVRLLELFCQQHIDGYCAFPHSVCFTSAVLGDKDLPAQKLADPTSIKLPKSGLFKVCVWCSRYVVWGRWGGQVAMALGVVSGLWLMALPCCWWSAVSKHAYRGPL